MFQRMYKDEPDNWQVIDEIEIRYRLNSYYIDVDLAIVALRHGIQQDTPFAIFRWVEKE